MAAAGLPPRADAAPPPRLGRGRTFDLGAGLSPRRCGQVRAALTGLVAFEAGAGGAEPSR
jgi:hypothetical protein